MGLFRKKKIFEIHYIEHGIGPSRRITIVKAIDIAAATKIIQKRTPLDISIIDWEEIK